VGGANIITRPIFNWIKL